MKTEILEIESDLSFPTIEMIATGAHIDNMWEHIALLDDFFNQYSKVPSFACDENYVRSLLKYEYARNTGRPVQIGVGNCRDEEAWHLICTDGAHSFSEVRSKRRFPNLNLLGHSGSHDLIVELRYNQEAFIEIKTMPDTGGKSRKIDWGGIAKDIARQSCDKDVWLLWCVDENSWNDLRAQSNINSQNLDQHNISTSLSCINAVDDDQWHLTCLKLRSAEHCIRELAAIKVFSVDQGEESEGPRKRYWILMQRLDDTLDEFLLDEYIQHSISCTPC